MFIAFQICLTYYRQSRLGFIKIHAKFALLTWSCLWLIFLMVLCSNICINFDEYFRACCAVDWFQKRTRPTGRGCSILWFWPQLTFSSPRIHSQLILPLYSRPFFFTLFVNLSICLLVVEFRLTKSYSDLWLKNGKVIVSMSGEKIFSFRVVLLFSPSCLNIFKFNSYHSLRPIILVYFSQNPWILWDIHLTKLRSSGYSIFKIWIPWLIFS